MEVGSIINIIILSFATGLAIPILSGKTGVQSVRLDGRRNGLHPYFAYYEEFKQRSVYVMKPGFHSNAIACVACVA